MDGRRRSKAPGLYPASVLVRGASHNRLNLAFDYYDNDVHQRVAVYARVSTDSVSQTNSFELQKKYYEDFVVRRKGSMGFAEVMVIEYNGKKKSVSERLVMNKLYTKEHILLANLENASDDSPVGTEGQFGLADLGDEEP